MDQHLQSFLTSKCFLLFWFIGTTYVGDAVKTLYIGGLFPLTGSFVGSTGKNLLSVCEQAINMVNNHSDILPSHRLQMIWSDTKCDPGHAANALFESLYTRPPMIMLLGAACSSATRATAQTGALWNLLQVSYASTSSDLSDKRRFPLLYNVVPPDSSVNKAKIAFLKHFQWKRIATLRQNDYVFNEVMESFHDSLIQNDFEIIASELLTDDPKIHIQSLKERDARIIVGMFYEEQARKVFCEVHKQGMFGERYMWLLLAWYDNKQWWQSVGDVNCTKEQMNQATDGYFSVENVGIVSNDKPTISGITSAEFLNTYSNQGENWADLYVPFAFDSVWIMGLTLNNSMHQLSTLLNKSLEDFTYTENNITKLLQQTLEKLEFQGITGRIQFADTGQRILPVYVRQLQEGYSVTVGTFFPDQDGIFLDGQPITWRGGHPPPDGKQTIYQLQYVSTALFCVIVILASGGIIVSMYFLWFNVRQREHSYIKLSSPNLNNVVILGCVLLYSSVFMVAIDGKRVDVSVLPGLCMAEGFIMAIGYTLVFGALFSKTWRVYQIFNKVKPKRKIFKVSELAGVIVPLVCIDAVVMSLWAGVDPPQLITQDIHLQVKDKFNNQRIIPQQQHCSSEYQTTWLYILLGYKLVLLLIGCYMAWVTRKVKVRYLNDTRAVGLSVYNIALFLIAGLPLSFLIDGHVNAFVACLSLFILIPTTVSLCLLFVPKIAKLKNNPGEIVRQQSLSAIRVSACSNIESVGTDSDPNAVNRLEDGIALLKREIRTLKLASRDTKPNLVVTIPNSMQNGNTASNFSHQSPSQRPQLGKRSITCHNAQDMKMGPKQVHRSCSFSGPYFQRRSLDFGCLSSTLVDPLLVLKAKNKELKRKVQEAKIFETGKLAKVLYENAELNKKIVELNIKNAPTEDADKVSRLIKENAELKRQLGEVSILNSVWCDTTQRLQRKQNDDTKMAEELKELHQLLSVDLRGRRASLSHPPPIGRSQSSVDLQRSMASKTSSISPVARDVLKNFSYNNAVVRITNACKGEASHSVPLTVADAGKSEPLHSSPPRIGRDSIDGCKSKKLLKENMVISSERVNEGSREHEETVPPSLTHQKTTEGDSKGKEHFRDQEQSRRADFEKGPAIKSSISGSETQTQDIKSSGKELQLIIDASVVKNTAYHWGENNTAESKRQDLAKHDEASINRSDPLSDGGNMKNLSLQKEKLKGKKEKKRNEKIEKTYFV